MNKGFTLVELISVIIILAILSLITTPVITGTIEKSRQKAALDSASKYKDAVDNQIISNQMRTSVMKKINSGVYDVPMDSEYGVSFKGDAPTSGWVVVSENRVISYSLVFKEKYLVNYDGEKRTIEVKKGIEPIEKPEIN